MRISEFIRNLPTESASPSALVTDWEDILGRQLDPDERTVITMWGDTMISLMAEVVQNQEIEGEADGPDAGSVEDVALRADSEPCVCPVHTELRRAILENRRRIGRGEATLPLPVVQPHAPVAHVEDGSA